MEAPMPFITTGEDGVRLELNEKAATWIRKNVLKPIVVVAIVGEYRKGKSFLHNLLLGRMNGFPLGATVNSETKGVWIWVVDHPLDKEKTLVLLDTEGLHDPEKGDSNHDTQIFVLSLLLCSVLVFNSGGKF